MSLVMTVTQECDASAEFQDAQGHAAEVQNPTWSSSDVGIVLVEPSADDPLKVVIKAAGSVGDAQVNIVGDADLGAGVSEVSAVLDVSIKSAQAVSVIVNVGTPREQGTTPSPGRRK